MSIFLVFTTFIFICNAKASDSCDISQEDEVFLQRLAIEYNEAKARAAEEAQKEAPSPADFAYVRSNLPPNVRCPIPFRPGEIPKKKFTQVFQKTRKNAVGFTSMPRKQSNFNPLAPTSIPSGHPSVIVTRAPFPLGHFENPC